MPPPRTIIVDRDTILKNIASIAAQQRTAVLAEPEIYTGQHATALAQAAWVPRDLPLLAGKPLTESERKRHQQAMVAMQAEGLIVLGTRHVRLVDGNVKPLEKSDSPAIEANHHLQPIQS